MMPARSGKVLASLSSSVGGSTLLSATTSSENRAGAEAGGPFKKVLRRKQGSLCPGAPCGQWRSASAWPKKSKFLQPRKRKAGARACKEGSQG